MDPPEHDELRAVVKSRFTPNSVAQLEPLVRVEVAALLAELPARQRFDAVDVLAWPLPNNVMCGVLGIPPSDRRQVARLYRTVMERVPGDETIPPTALAAASELRAYLLDLAEYRRRRPLADLMTAIATAEVGGARLPERKVVGMAFVLLSAGIDTVASLLGNALLLLALHPEERAKLLDAPERLPNAIEEALRFESPLQFNARITTGAVEVQGAAIPAGARVLLLYGAANRDERRFPDPDRFDITREPQRHLAFGEGIHFCIGAALARLETRVALSAWLAAMPSYALDGQPERMAAYNMRSLRQLPVAVGG